MNTRKKRTQRQSDQQRCEEMSVEFVGGPFDGARLILDVVRDGPDAIRVLERTYTKQFRTVRAVEVEQPAKEAP